MASEIVVGQDRDRAQHGVLLREIEDARLVEERDLLLNVASERSLILCTALSEHRVRDMVARIDPAWSVGDRVPCTRSVTHAHQVLIRR